MIKLCSIVGILKFRKLRNKSNEFTNSLLEIMENPRGGFSTLITQDIQIIFQ